MRKVIVQEFTTIDGFAAGPNGELDFIADSTHVDAAAGEASEDQLRFIGTIDTILLGAVTYRMFAQDGLARDDDARGRCRLAALPAAQPGFGLIQPRYWSSRQDGTGASSKSVRPPFGSA